MIGCFRRYSRLDEVCQNPRGVRIFLFADEVFGKPAIVKEALGKQLLDEGFGGFAELFLELLAELVDGVILSSEQFERVMVDVVHDRLC